MVVLLAKDMQCAQKGLPASPGGDFIKETFELIRVCQVKSRGKDIAGRRNMSVGIVLGEGTVCLET